MAITGGFGMMMDLQRGTVRRWVLGRDGVKRWADTLEPVETQPLPREAEEPATKGHLTRTEDGG